MFGTDVADYKKRRRQQLERDREEEVVVEARLLDLKKTYPRVGRPVYVGHTGEVWTKGRCLETLKGFHKYTPHVLFNVFHQAVKRRTEEERGQAAHQRGTTPGILWKYVPGSNFPSLTLWVRYNSEAREVIITRSLFVDGITILGIQRELEEGVNKVNEVMRFVL